MAKLRPPLWNSLPGHRLLKGRAGHTITLVGKKLFMIGGRNGNEFFNDLWEFNIETKQWKLLQKHTPFTARAYHTATLIDSKQLWVIGGSDTLTMYGDVHVLDTDSLEWTSSVIEGELAGKLRGTHAAIQHPLQEKGILVCGGYGGVNSHWLSDLAILHTDILMWEELHPKGVAPVGRGYHTFTAFGIHVLLFGGKGDKGIISSDAISVYDAEANMWMAPRVRGTAPVSRSNHAAALVKDDLIFMCGGRNGSERLRDICLLQIRSPAVAGCVDSLEWRVVEQEKPKVQRKGRPLKSEDPGGRSAHSLVVEDSSLYLFGGYGGGGITYSDIFVLQVADIDGSTPKGASKSVQKGLDRRPRTEIDDTDGWRSTKQHRRHSFPAAKAGQVGQVHILDSDGDHTTEDISERVNDILGGPVSHAVINGIPERRRSSVGLRNDRPQRPQEVEAERTETLQDRPHPKPAWERDKHGLEVSSLQQMVDSLKAEVNSLKASIDIKDLLESELRAGKAALQQNIQLLQNQVEEGNQKTRASNKEIEKWKLEAQGHLAEVSEKERERSEAVQKMTNSEQKMENLSKSLETMKAAHSKATHDLDCCKREVQNLVSEVEKQTLEKQKIMQSHEQQVATLSKEAIEKTAAMERLSKELEASKDSSKALHETVDRLAKHVERDNAKIDALEKEKEKLASASDAVLAEHVRLAEAKDSAEAAVELIKGELRVGQSVVERNKGEISRMRESAEQAKEHITSLHSSLKKNEEEVKLVLDENEKLRLLIKDIEDFENAQVRNIQNHVEKLRCVREFGPRS
ncbi:unnamed protein product [Calypogeia fissa]